MIIEDISKIVISFCFGFLLSPFSWGILYLPMFMIIFGTIDYLFYGGKFEYEYFEHRTSIIYYSFLGFIIGRTFHELNVVPIENFHKKKKKKIIKHNVEKYLLLKDLKFISNIKKDKYINISDKENIDFSNFYFYIYRLIIFSTEDEIIKFVNNNINNGIILLETDKDEKLLTRVKNCKVGIQNLINTYKKSILIKDKMELLIQKIDNLKL